MMSGVPRHQAPAGTDATWGRVRVAVEGDGDPVGVTERTTSGDAVTERTTGGDADKTRV